MGRKPSNAKNSELQKNVTPEPSTKDAPSSAASASDGDAFVTRNTGEDAPVSNKKRLSLPITEDNRIDWDTLRTKTQNEIKDVLRSDPRIREVVGFSVRQSDDSMISEENVRVFLGNLNRFNGWVCGQVIKRQTKGALIIDPDILAQAYSFTSEQYSELCPRGARIANKWAPDWSKKYQDEFFFCLMYLGYVGEQMKTAVQLQMLRNDSEQKAAQAAAQPNGHAQPQQFPPEV
jgi:hypothetical protein